VSDVASSTALETLWGALPAGNFVGNVSTMPHRQVKFIAELLDSSGIVPLIDQWLEEDFNPAGPGGRPRALGTRPALVLMLLLSVEHTSQLVKDMAYVAASRLTRQSMEYLGLAGPAAYVKGKRRTAKQWYTPLYRSLSRAIRTFDPKPVSRPGSRGKFPTLAEVDAMRAGWESDSLKAKAERLSLIGNMLVEATLQLVPEEFAKNWEGDTVVDATVTAAYAKRGAPHGGTHGPIDPSAGWYLRDSEHKTVDAKSKKIKKAIYGWDLTVVNQTNHDPSELAHHPLLIAGLGITVPATNLIATATNIYKDIVRRGHPVGRLTGDRGYMPSAKAEDFQIPLRALGYDLRTDYEYPQLGRNGKGGEYAGAIQVEGNWYCPSMPDNLIDATIQLRDKVIDHKTWRLRIAERRHYMLRPKEKPDKNGSVAMMCPARGPGSTAICPLAAGCGSTSRNTATRSTKDRDDNPVDAKVTIYNPPEHPDSICTNKTSLNFPATAGAKFAQTVQYGSQKWASEYKHDRNTIEGFNGFAKDESKEGLGTPGKRRLRGIAAQFLLISFIAVAANLRKIQAFRDEQLSSDSDEERAEKRKQKQAVRQRRKHRNDRVAPWGDFRSSDPPPDAEATDPA